jgi:hypothetical protein
MHYFFEDLTGLAAATLLSALLIVLPGFGIAGLAARAELIDDSDPVKRACWGLLLGPALLPTLDALLLRWTGMAGVLIPHIALAALGARSALETARRIPARWWLAVLACWLFVAWANVDFDWNRRLNQPVTIIDTVKHAAVVAELARRGLPLHDPFFARPGIAGYYYYFYLGPALIHWLGGALIDARAAFAAGSFVTMLAFAAMLMRLAQEARLIPQGRFGPFVKWLLLLCCISGFDLIPGIAFAKITGITFTQLDSWDEEVRWVLTSILWVPHHMTAVIAIFAACLALAERSRGSQLLRAVLAGTAFATAFGCSAWVAIAAAPVLALWWLYDRKFPDPTPLWSLPLAGVTALLLSVPQLLDLAAGRGATVFPLGFYIRTLGPFKTEAHTLSEALLKLALIPVGYLFEFGIFALGASVFLARGGVGLSRSTSIGRLLLVGTPIALLLATFVRSTIIYNDFGWRAIWFAQIPALLWTSSLLSREQQQRRSLIWAGALGLGLAAILWDMAGLRLIRRPQFYVFDAYVNARPDVDYNIRGTYRWIDRNLPAGMMVQHNPNLPFRALDFGLYSDRPVPVADVQARLFGADPAAVEARLDSIAPIFAYPVSAAQAGRRASAAGAGAILLTAADPAWRTAGGPPAGWKCLYRSQYSCVMVLERTK